MDTNKPNDPEYCQNAVGDSIERLTRCKQSDFIVICRQTCGVCPPLVPQPSPPPPSPKSLMPPQSPPPPSP
eukprot:scaffold91924_cov18-Phaeocystis_antarctica.AAC.1